MARVLRSPLHWSLLASLLAAGAVTLTALRRPYERQWVVAALWVAGVLCWAWACRTPAVERSRSRLTRIDLAALALLALVAAALLLPALSVYPLEMAGDPVRDSGLRTQWLVRGENGARLFTYGNFNGYSLVMSATSAPFYLIFGPSSLSFKALSALLGIATPLLLFLLARRYLSATEALAAALLLLALPVYLFYARREPIHAYNPFWMIAVLAALLRVIEHEAKPRTLGLLGMMAGLMVHFHAAVKAAAFLALAVGAGTAFWRACAGRLAWRRLVAGAAAAVLGFFIALGPLVLESNAKILLSSQRFRAPGTSFDAAVLLDGYQRSLRVFFDQPTRSWFPVHQPLIPSPVLASLFALGAALGFLVVPRRVHAVLLFFLLVLPLTNSTLTDIVNGDHRLTPLLPVIAWVMANGLGVLWRACAKLRPLVLTRSLQAALLLVIGIAAAGQIHRFWSEEQGRHRGNLAAHLLYFARRQIEATPELRAAAEPCVGGVAWVRAQMELIHFREGWSFYLPDALVRTATIAQATAANQIFVAASCDQAAATVDWQERIYCSPRQWLVCPGPETDFSEVKVYVPADQPVPTAPRPAAAARTSGGEPDGATPTTR